MYDVIIIGAGPAGITAGIYCKRANLKTLILEKESIGGQIASSPLVENFPGFKSISGAELANNFYEQADNLDIPIEIEEVTKIIPGKVNKIITDCGEYETKTIIIATGSKYRLLGLPNEVELIGKGIAFCTSCDGAFFKGKDIAVVGGGNTAITNALYMTNLANKVYVVVREEDLMCEKVLADNLKSKSNVEIIFNTQVKGIVGTDELEKIILDSGRELNIQGMFISIGMKPQTEMLKDVIKLSEYNYVDSTDCTTNEKNIFVAGDVRDKKVRQLTTAVSDGAIAAINVIKYIENNQ